MLFYFIYFLINPILFVCFFFVKFFNKKLYTHLRYEKKSIKGVLNKLKKIDRSKYKILLFHAASAGEFEQLKPILKGINRSHFFIIQSFSSPTIYKKESNNKLFDISCYHPYDFFWKSYFFFKNIKPDSYIITRHDIWPIHLFIANNLNIKIFYINANLHKNSIWCKSYMKNISQIIFKNIDFCIVPSKQIYSNACKVIDTKKILLISDSRFDQIFNRYEKNKDLNLLPSYFNKTKNIIFGSYDYFDEKLIVEALNSVYKKGNTSLEKSNTGIILVPHEPSKVNVSRMINILKKNNFKVEKFSSLKTQQRSNIIIIDKVGLLADLYKYSQLAYIGAGFGRGVHSVIEPAVYKSIISFGPNIEMLNEAKDLYENKLAYMIFNLQDLVHFINLNINDLLHKKMKNNLSYYMNKNKNASNKILKKIIELS